MLNQYSCKLTRIVTSSIFAATLVTTPLLAADNSSWVDQQRAMSDGYSFAYGASNAGPEGRRGTVYVGAKLENSAPAKSVAAAVYMMTRTLPVPSSAKPNGTTLRGSPHAMRNL